MTHVTPVAASHSQLMAIIRTAAENLPDDSWAGVGLPEFRELADGEPVEIVDHYSFLSIPSITWCESLQEIAKPQVAMNGPCAQWGRLSVRYTTPDGARGSYTVENSRVALLRLADKVAKLARAFGAKPERTAKPVPAVRWSAVSGKVWKEQIECKEFADVLRIGCEKLGAIFVKTGTSRPFMYVMPLPVAGLPDDFCSARRDDGEWLVFDTVSGYSLGGRGFSSRKACEAAALDQWNYADEEKRQHVLTQARQHVVPQSDAKAAWCELYGVDDAAELPPALADMEPEPVALPAPELVAEPEPVAAVADAAPAVAHPLADAHAKLATYKARAANPDDKAPDGFLPYLIEGARKDLHRLTAAFAVFDAVGDGTELANTDGSRFCVLLPDASQPGKYRYSVFDARGFSTHHTEDTAAAAVADAARQGFTVAAPGVLDRLAACQEWARGMAVSEVIQAANMRLIDWPTAHQRLDDIAAQFDTPAPAPAPEVAQLEPEPVVSITASQPAADPAIVAELVASYECSEAGAAALDSLATADSAYAAMQPWDEWGRSAYAAQRAATCRAAAAQIRAALAPTPEPPPASQHPRLSDALAILRAAVAPPVPPVPSAQQAPDCTAEVRQAPASAPAAAAPEPVATPYSDIGTVHGPGAPGGLAGAFAGGPAHGPTPLYSDIGAPSVSRYRYSKNSMVARCPSSDGYKSRAARLAESIGMRWVHRAGGYVGSPSAAAKLESLYRSGFDANSYTRELIPPAQPEPLPTCPAAQPETGPAVASPDALADAAPMPCSPGPAGASAQTGRQIAQAWCSRRPAARRRQLGQRRGVSPVATFVRQTARRTGPGFSPPWGGLGWRSAQAGKPGAATPTPYGDIGKSFWPLGAAPGQPNGPAGLCPAAALPRCAGPPLARLRPVLRPPAPPRVATLETR